MTRILVVGGGASGVLLAIHLLHDGAVDNRVTVVERRPELGAGAAYATTNPNHLLNVRASNMSAFPQDQDHFVRWLSGRAGTDPQGRLGAHCFAPRHLYRDYLASLLAPFLADGRLQCLHAEALAVHQSESGVAVECRDGARLKGDVAVIATGNEGAKLPPEPWRFEGWADPGLYTIPRAAPVVVVGTGLTMVDRVLALLHDGHSGPITAVSRRGLTPQAHRIGAPCAISASEVPFGAIMPDLFTWMRKRVKDTEAAGGDWRSIVDAIRPHTQLLWERLPQAERGRFLRHARPFWDIHRHRIAPEAARRLELARTLGQFRSLAAHVVGYEPRGAGVDVHLSRRSTKAHEVIHAEAVFECRGRASDVSQSENPVILDLLRTGTARPDPLGLGLAVTSDCAVVSVGGQASDRIYALGPVTSGTFWEIVAIPDIRVQAARLAGRLLTRS